MLNDLLFAVQSVRADCSHCLAHGIWSHLRTLIITRYSYKTKTSTKMQIKYKPEEKNILGFVCTLHLKTSTYFFGYQTQNILLSLLCFVFKHKMHCFLLLLLTKRHSWIVSVSPSKQFGYFSVNRQYYDQNIHMFIISN